MGVLLAGAKAKPDKGHKCRDAPVLEATFAHKLRQSRSKQEPEWGLGMLYRIGLKAAMKGKDDRATAAVKSWIEFVTAVRRSAGVLGEWFAFAFENVGAYRESTQGWLAGSWASTLIEHLSALPGGARHSSPAARNSSGCILK